MKVAALLTGRGNNTLKDKAFILVAMMMKYSALQKVVDTKK
jgi:hypothetical protein